MMNVKGYVRKTLLLSAAFAFISPMAFAMEIEGEYAMQRMRTQQPYDQLSELERMNRGSYRFEKEQQEELERLLTRAQESVTQSDIGRFKDTFAAFEEQYLREKKLPRLMSTAHDEESGFSDEQRAELQALLPAGNSSRLKLEIAKVQKELARFRSHNLLQSELSRLADIVQGRNTEFAWLSGEQNSELERRLSLAGKNGKKLEDDVNGVWNMLAHFQYLRTLESQLPGLEDIAHRRNADFSWISDEQSTELQSMLPATGSPQLEDDMSLFYARLISLQKARGFLHPRDHLPYMAYIANGMDPRFSWLSDIEKGRLKSLIPAADSPTLESDVKRFYDHFAGYQITRQGNSPLYYMSIAGRW